MHVTEAVKKIVGQIAPKSEVILFGSRARGDHNRDSDWDFLILLHTNSISKQEKIDIQERLYELELELGAVISAIIHTKNEWENRAVTPIYQIIKREGQAA